MQPLEQVDPGILEAEGTFARAKMCVDGWPQALELSFLLYSGERVSDGYKLNNNVLIYEGSLTP